MPTGEKSASKTVGEPTTKSATPDPFDLDRPASAQKAPIVVVQPQAFDVSASQLVAIALRGCHDAEVEPGKSAILLVNPTGDSFISDRAVAIKDALKASGDHHHRRDTVFDEQQAIGERCRGTFEGQRPRPSWSLRSIP